MLIVTNKEENMSIVSFLQWEMHAARQSYECNPCEPQPDWDDLTDDTKIALMESDLEHDLTFGGWHIENRV